MQELIPYKETATRDTIATLDLASPGLTKMGLRSTTVRKVATVLLDLRLRKPVIQVLTRTKNDKLTVTSVQQDSTVQVAKVNSAPQSTAQ